jgi:hypothetical protein
MPALPESQAPVPEQLRALVLLAAEPLQVEPLRCSMRRTAQE